jgi:hypothetical protein
MSGGGLSQLNANEDVVFCLNPQISYFKSVYRKYTKFIISDYEVSANSVRGNLTSEGLSFDFPAQGELLSDVSMRILKADSVGQIIPDNIGTSLIKKVDFIYQGANQANNNIVESIPAEYINIMSMLNNNRTINATYDKIGSDNSLVCNNGNNYQNMALSGGVRNNSYSGSHVYNMDAIVPIPFSFTGNIGSSLPILKLDKNKLKIKITKTDKNSEDFTPEFYSSFIFTIILKFIYLSEEEKYRFISSDQEYLIKKIKEIDVPLKNTMYNISTNNPSLPLTSIFIVNKSASGTGSNKIQQYDQMTYQLNLRGVDMQQTNLPHEFYSKLNIDRHFKGCIYKDYNEIDSTSFNGSYLTVENNIAYIPLALKESEGPSGCIDTSINDLKLSFNNLSNSDVTLSNYSFRLYLIYHTIMTVKDMNIFFPYGFI